MYLLEDLVKEYQKDLVNEFNRASRFNEVDKNESVFQDRWRVNLGNFLITSGLKLKGIYQNSSKAVHFTVSG